MNKLKVIKEAIRMALTTKHGHEKKLMEKFMREGGEIPNYNICGIKDKREYAKTFNRTLKFMKSRIFEPGIFLINGLFGHMKSPEIPKEDYNYVLTSFDDAFNNTLDMFNKIHLGARDDVKDDYTCRTLSSLRDWLMTIVKMDTTYRMFFEILLIETHKELNKHFKKRNHPCHLLYSNKNYVNDPHYIVMSQNVINGNMGLALYKAAKEQNKK